MDTTQIKSAIKHAGGQERVAIALGYTRQAVNNWVKRKIIPSRCIIPLCRLINFAVTPHQIDPLLYPNPLDGITPPTEGA